MMSGEIKIPQESAAQLREAQRELHDLMPVVDKLEECGVDCNLYREKIRQGIERSTKILEHFGK